MSTGPQGLTQTKCRCWAQKGSGTSDAYKELGGRSNENMRQWGVYTNLYQ